MITAGLGATSSGRPRRSERRTTVVRNPSAEGFPLAYNCRPPSRHGPRAMSQRFAARTSVEQVAEGQELAPKFAEHGLIPAVTTGATSGELLVVGYMNAEA